MSNTVERRKPYIMDLTKVTKATGTSAEEKYNNTNTLGTAKNLQQVQAKQPINEN